jgi:pimeloyl-ACP methyl ester carboxylesterase
VITTVIPYGRGSRAYWSANPSGTVVVFVHGFNGHATASWTEFDRLLTGSNDDVVFYGYDSLRGRTNVMALRLLECISDLMENGAKFVNGSVDAGEHRASSFRFQRLVLVAHSLGAVVSRSAMLHAKTKGARWLPQAQLCLYAPAHKGAHVLELVSSAMSLFNAPVSAIAKWRFPVLLDLEQGSEVLQELATQTTDAIEQGHTSLGAKLIVIAEEDAVVNTNVFCKHDHPGVVLALSHSAVCKPPDEHSQPFLALQEILGDHDAAQT